MLQVGVVSFSTDAVTPPGNDETTCYETQLAKATPENRKYLNQYVNKLKAVYDTYYIDALNKAFDFFENTQKGMFDNFKRGKNCINNIVIVLAEIAVCTVSGISNDQ